MDGPENRQTGRQRGKGEGTTGVVTRGDEKQATGMICVTSDRSWAETLITVEWGWMRFVSGVITNEENAKKLTITR